MHTVIGAFDARPQAQQAMDRLERSGFDRADMHMEFNQAGAATETGRVTTVNTGTGTVAQEPPRERGFFSEFFSNLFGDEDASRSRNFDEAVRRGSYVVVVDAPSDAKATQAATLLHDAGAIDVDERARAWAAERGGQAGKLDVVQEELHVGKRELDRGGVRVVQRVSQKPVREVVRLRDEHARVQRTPVDRPVRADEIDTFKEGTVEVREKTEEPVVAKTARVVEEVRVGKDVREHEETIDDTVRRKDVDVQRLDERTSAERERAVAAGTPRDPNRRGR